jgi:uncharacterized protein (UPF0264 family)
MREIRLSTVTIRSLTLMAVEDAIEYLAMDYPGLAEPIRKGLPIRSRELNVEILAEKICSRCTPQRKTSVQLLLKSYRELDSTKTALVDPWLVSWNAFVVRLDEINQRSQPRSDAKNPALWFQTTVENEAIVLVNQQLIPQADLADVVSVVSDMLSDYREHEVDQLDPSDRLALLYAYSIVEGGTVPNQRIHPIQTDVLREYPTYLALADPGKGHLQTTVYSKEMLQGTIVHVETIDRQGNNDRQAVEPYRIPSIRDVARIRVHVGSTTPCSVFVGRPVFEGWKRGEKDFVLFRQSLLKAAHTVGAACSSMFYLGVAECKIGMDGLTSIQAIEVMQAIAGNVIRDRSRQRLSAAFNINTPIMDDRGVDRANAVEVTGHTEIACLAIDLTSSGGFDKVTLDGAIDGKSVPFLKQMKPEALIDFVHRAHEKGLETYISAGMDASNIGDAVRIGIGGVGMGIRLHEDNQVKEITHIKRDALEVLRKRDEAWTEAAGKAAALLAKLDWLRSGEAITQEQDERRDDLFVQLKEYHRSSRADRETKERLTGKLNRLIDELSLVVNQRAETLKQGEIRGPGDEFDPIFAIAAAQVKADEIKGKETDPELKAYLERRDAESLKCLMGYQ